MNHTLLYGALLMPLTLVACADDNCEVLAEICETCPADGLGPSAKGSCLRAVATDDDFTCETQVEQRAYAPFGCTIK